MEQGIKTLHECNPNEKQVAKITAVIAALNQAIKGELCTDPNFPIQGDSFQYDTWMAMQSNQTIRLQAGSIMIAGQAALEAAQENLLLVMNPALPVPEPWMLQLVTGILTTLVLTKVFLRLSRFNYERIEVLYTP